MKRRTFTKLTGVSAITTTGFIKFNSESYVGDCETTTDILVSFFRPDSPMRNNLVISGLLGKLVELVILNINKLTMKSLRASRSTPIAIGRYRGLNKR